MVIKLSKTGLLKFAHLLLALVSITAGQAQSESTITFYHQDALGSNIAATNENGDVIWYEEYQPYGEKIYELGKDKTTGNQDWYTGKNYDEDLDLTYFGARWYDAKQGRFLSIDPVPIQPGNIHSFNRYVYANNNPYKYVDPDGRAAIAPAPDDGLRGVTGAEIDRARSFGNIPSAASAAADMAVIVGVIKGIDTASDIVAPVKGLGKAAIKKLVTKGTLKPKPGSAGGDGAKKPFSTKVKDQARAESNDTCVFCGTKTTRQPGPTRSEIDHSIPKSRGGNNSLENAQNTCRTCNRQKGAKTTEEF